VVNKGLPDGIGLKSLTEALDTSTAGGKLVFHILAINAHPLEKAKPAIAKTHRAKTRRFRGVFAL
jgi:hypothetical protein